MATRLDIQEALKQSMLAKDELRTGTLRMLLAAFSNQEKEKRYKVSKAEPALSEQELQAKSVLTSEEIQDAVSSEAKKRRESIEAFEKGGRKDLVGKEQKELEILQRYLPEQLSEEEVRTLVQEAIKATGAETPNDMGKVMAELMPKVKGKADGATISRIVKELLTSK